MSPAYLVFRFYQLFDSDKPLHSSTNYMIMSLPIWPVVTENLAEQLSAAQGGIVHPTQLLPYLPLSLRLIEQTLDTLTESQRVAKQPINGLSAYVFKESLNKPQQNFAPRQCVYSDEPLSDHEHSAISRDVRQKIETELSLMATHDCWPAEAVWEHELIYLANNLTAAVTASRIAGHSRLSFKKVEQRLATLKARGFILCERKQNNWELPPMRYPRPLYKRHDQFIRQFPGALQEETEVRLLKALGLSLLILLLCFALAVTARVPFPFVLFGGLGLAAIVFIKTFRAPPKPLPSV